MIVRWQRLRDESNTFICDCDLLCKAAETVQGTVQQGPGRTGVYVNMYMNNTSYYPIVTQHILMTELLQTPVTAAVSWQEFCQAKWNRTSRKFVNHTCVNLPSHEKWRSNIFFYSCLTLPVLPLTPTVTIKYQIGSFCRHMKQQTFLEIQSSFRDVPRFTYQH